MRRCVIYAIYDYLLFTIYFLKFYLIWFGNIWENPQWQRQRWIKSTRSSHRLQTCPIEYKTNWNELQLNLIWFLEKMPEKKSRYFSVLGNPIRTWTTDNKGRRRLKCQWPITEPERRSRYDVMQRVHQWENRPWKQMEKTSAVVAISWSFHY